MTSRTDIAISLARAANPVDPDPNHSAWADAEGQAAFERILADPGPSSATAPAPRLPRTRRRLAIGVGVAAAAGAAVALVGLPGSPNHGGAGAAWAVTKNADGSVTVNLNDYRDPAGLQAKLRAAGVRANVTTAPDKCITPLPGAAEYAMFDGDLSTFHAPYTWQKLFAGTPTGLVGRGPGYGVTADTGGKSITLPNGEVMPAHMTFTVHPSEMPSGDDLNIGFGSGGNALLVDVEKTGTPLQCSTPQVTTPPDDGSTPTS